MSLQHLLLPLRRTRSNDLLSSVCFWSGIQVHRLSLEQALQVPVDCTLANTAVHGGPDFCRRVAAALQGTVAEPDDAFLTRVPSAYLRRDVSLMQLWEARRLTAPSFIKPVNDKHFPARVYLSGSELPVTASLDQWWVLVSEPVRWLCEYRMFIRDRRVQTCSAYSPSGTVSGIDAETRTKAQKFCEQLLADPLVKLPGAVVLDVGWIKDAGWAIVEANAATMSSLYEGDPVAVLRVLEAGLTPTEPASAFINADGLVPRHQ